MRWMHQVGPPDGPGAHRRRARTTGWTTGSNAKSASGWSGPRGRSLRGGGRREQLVEGAGDLRSREGLRDQEDAFGFPGAQALVRLLGRVANENDGEAG